MSGELAELTAAQQALAEVETVEEAKALYDQLEALSQYAKRYRLEEDKQNAIAETKLLTAHKGGDILATTVSAGNPQLFRDGTIRQLPAGMSRQQSHRWQRLRAAPLNDFKSEIKRLRKDKEEVTVAAMLLFARKYLRPPAVSIDPPEGEFRCIVIDPPWPMEKLDRRDYMQQGEFLGYATMTLEDIEALPIPDLVAADGCHVYLWVTHRFLPDGLRLFDAWGVRYECQFTWLKPSGFTPFSWMYNTEHVLFGRAGESLPLEQLGLKLGFQAATDGHSVKPDHFHEIVVQASPEPRLEMFARRPREGFQVWGNEVAA